jgi:hypothetical protein
MATNVPPLPGAPSGPVPKKVSPVVWILGGCAVIVVLGAIALTLGGLFIAHKVRQAGLDPDLLQRHPELAVVKMMVAANPDAELVRVDENRGIVTVRDKKTGKTITMNFEDIKKGKMTFEAEGKKVEVEAHGQGDQGTLTMKTDEGTAKFGAGAVKLPAWLPAYQGASIQGFSAQTATGSGGSFGFKTDDPADKVAAFYKDALEQAGFTVEINDYPGGKLLNGRAGARTAVIHVMSAGSGSTVNGSFEDK